jgi:GDP-4-dehydro-6-deoxy-D-mannose reductase
LAVEALALQHHRAFQVPAILVRPFNLTGPGEHASFVTSAFARQIALIEAGRQEPVIKAGDLTTTRDFMDVRDAARALAILAEVGQPGDVYNVCSDVPLRIDTLVSSLVGASRTQIEVRSEPSLMRVVEIRHQWGNSCKLRKATGWEPGYKLEQTLTDVLDDWRVRIQTEA